MIKLTKDDCIQALYGGLLLGGGRRRQHEDGA